SDHAAFQSPGRGVKYTSGFVAVMKTSTPAQYRQFVQPLRDYYSRVLAYIVAAATVAAGAHAEHFQTDILWVVPYALLYPQVIHLLCRPLQRKFPQKTNLSLLLIDAVQMGIGIVLIGFCVVPSLMLVL